LVIAYYVIPIMSSYFLICGYYFGTKLL
jgi:hypothetical protein